MLVHLENTILQTFHTKKKKRANDYITNSEQNVLFISLVMRRFWMETLNL